MADATENGNFAVDFGKTRWVAADAIPLNELDSNLKNQLAKLSEIKGMVI